MLARLAFGLLLSVPHSTLGLLGNVTYLRLSSAQVFVDGTLGLLREVSRHATSDFLNLSASFFQATVNLIFINAHVCLL